ncbi:hypothetical protein RhiirC2_774515 [Rhizophagus irregularis]|uniref:Uncharacterized protein n=1 Tax=Rhizophagus irregularis TaxID=588596 RepID=A0A2N1NLC8_9GLOM|nr:hypothetical protein RhiirC2_774515 [Rhizophagus irregularis]
MLIAKKRSEAKSASFDFCIKKISVYGVDVDILEEIQKFPFPFQQLIIREACAHIFHEYMYSNKLLTTDTEQQKNTKNRRIAMGELTKRMHDRYWHVEEMGDINLLFLC